MASTTTPSVRPFLFCDDVAASQDFLVRAFGMRPGDVARGSDGVAVVAQAWLGEHAVHLARPHRGSMEPARKATVLHSLVMVYVDDVDAVFERAQAAGATIEYAPQDMDYGQREFGARDRDGNLWCFGTLLEHE